MAETADQKALQQYETALKKAMELRVVDIGSALKLTKETLRECQREKDPFGQFACCAYLAFFQMIDSDYEQVKITVAKANLILPSAGMPHFEAILLYSQGSVCYKTDDYHLGIQYLIKAYELFKLAHDKAGQSKAQKALGSIYEIFKDYDKARKAYLHSIELSEAIGDLNGKSNALNPLSGLFLRDNKLEEAEKAIDESIALKKQTGDKRGEAFALYGKGKIQLKLGAYQAAQTLFEKALSIHLELKTLEGEAMVYNKMGELNMLQNNNDKAKYFFEKVVQNEAGPSFHLIINKAHYNLYLMSKDNGDMPAALHHLEKHLYHYRYLASKETKTMIKSISSLSKVEVLERESKIQQEKNKEIEKKNAELDNFVYKVSHDLRGPITSLMGLYNVVKMEVDEPKALQYFALYNDQIMRLNEIIIDFINLTRIKEMKLVPEPIQFESIIEDCIGMYSYFPVHQKINFIINVEEALFFESDKSTINTIIQNLIENAIKYARNDIDPFCHVSIKQNNGQLVIRVEDNGIGIDKKHQEKIFTMFFRANDITQGSGLGLYILKNAVEKLNGAVRFYSEVHRGSTFVVELPLVP